jgi:hypothetical protein
VKLTMYAWALLILALVAAVPALSQVAPEASGGTSDDTQMQTPPPVSNQSYPTEVGAEARSNYLRAGLSFSTSYIDNLYAGSITPLGETTYSILPTIAYDQTTPRQHRMFTYSPGFTFYQPSSTLNEVDQNLNALYEYRLTEHLTLNANDSFQKSSDSAGTLGSANGGAVSGSSSPITPGIVAPFAQRLTNSASGQLTYEFSAAGMVGGSGTLMKMDYPNASESSGLSDSDERGGSAFYNRRISATQYIGVNYQYSHIVAYPQSSRSVTQLHNISAYYTISPTHTLSISVSSGPQYYTLTQTLSSGSGGWGPLVVASIGWQRARTNLAASYSRQVTAGGGLIGASDSSSAVASVRWLVLRTLSAGASSNYAINKSIATLLNADAQNGHSISGAATIGYTINQHFTVNFEYDRVHQSYSGIAAISSNPNSDRETISLAWQFMRPIGR